MYYKHIPISTRLSTVAVLIWVLSCMYHHMFFFCFKANEKLITLVAVMWFLSGVSLQMIFKIGSTWKCFLTLVACVWFLFCACPHIDLKIPSTRKSFITLVACVWSLSSVRPHMDSKIPSKWKCLITLVANIWFLTSVCLNVFKVGFFLGKFYHTSCVHMVSLWCEFPNALHEYSFTIVCAPLWFSKWLFCDCVLWSHKYQNILPFHLWFNWFSAYQ